MESFFIHLLKSSGILLLFLVSYYTFLKKETFFESNRFFLGAGLLASILLPFFTITKTVYVERAPVTIANLVELTPAAQIDTPETFNWLGMLLFTYLTGVIFFTFRFLLQLRAINQIKKKSAVVKENEFYHVKTSTKISPFSFFKHLFYYPLQFNQEELQTILIHEKEHAKGLHSVDILLTEIVCILQWFNPAIWFYKIMVKQNLEFLADSKTCAQFENKKQYQYLMLKQVVGHQKITIANPFFNSLIKKRIVMLNQNQSKKMNTLKLLFVVPVLAVFMMAFNTKTEHVTIVPSSTENVNKVNSIKYIITKSTSNKELEQIKSDLTIKNIDFSYTTVRDNNTNIIDIELNLKGTGDENVDFVMNYKSNSNSPIEDIVLSNKGSAYFIVSNSEKNADTAERILKANNQDPYRKTIENIQISNVTLDVNKDSKNENLRKDSEFLAQRGVNVAFKGIKRNSADEITAIKVTFDNGSGDKGNYQQKKTTAISPFKISVSFDKDGLATIDILAKGEETEKENIFVFEGLDEIGEHDDIIIKNGNGSKSVWITKDTDEMETIEIITEDGVKKVVIDGEEVDVDEIHQNHFSFSTDDEDHDVRVKVISKDGKKKLKKHKIKKYKKGGENVFILKDSDEDSEHEETMIFLGSDESDTASGKVQIKTMGKDPLYIIDGKEVSKKEFKKLEPDDIATINVYKGEKASEKYGKKAKDGVVEVVTKDKE